MFIKELENNYLTFYRYGFNGKEKDGEVSGEGNQYDYGFRIYNPRLGRFLSVDPMFHTFPWWTPYQYASNNPLKNIDLDGLESKESISSKIDCPLCQGKEPQIRVQETKQKPRPIHRKAIGRITIVQRDNENNPTGLGASLGVEVKSKNEFADNFDYRNPRFVNKLRININGIDYEGPGFIITSNDDGGGQIRIIIARNDADAPLSEGEQMQVDFLKNQIEAGTILCNLHE